MNFVLMIVMSSAVFLPSTFTMTPFDSETSCRQALVEANKQWSTVNDQSKCIDLDKEAKKRDLQKQLKELK